MHASLSSLASKASRPIATDTLAKAHCLSRMMPYSYHNHNHNTNNNTNNTTTTTTNNNNNNKEYQCSLLTSGSMSSSPIGMQPKLANVGRR